jgi:hypothetical protein
MLKSSHFVTFSASALVGAAVCMSGVASAWFVRMPPDVCMPWLGDQNSEGATTVGPFRNGATLAMQNPNASTYAIATCPFISTGNNGAASIVDNQVNGIAVDLTNPTSTTMPAGSTLAEACSTEWTSWTTVCGAQSSSVALTPGAVTTIWIGDRSAWTGDSAVGYAFVFIENGFLNVNSYVLGTYFST